MGLQLQQLVSLGGKKKKKKKGTVQKTDEKSFLAVNITD